MAQRGSSLTNFIDLTISPETSPRRESASTAHNGPRCDECFIRQMLDDEERQRKQEEDQDLALAIYLNEEFLQEAHALGDDQGLNDESGSYSGNWNTNNRANSNSFSSNTSLAFVNHSASLSDNETSDNESLENESSDNESLENEPSDNESLENESSDNESLENESSDNESPATTSPSASTISSVESISSISSQETPSEFTPVSSDADGEDGDFDTSENGQRNSSSTFVSIRSRNRHDSLNSINGEDAETDGDGEQQQRARRGLTPAEISAFPASNYLPLQRSVSSGGDGSTPAMSDSNVGEDCRICMSAFELRDLVRTLPCLHRFHPKCIDNWLKLKATCPMCRMQLRDQFAG